MLSETLFRKPRTAGVQVLQRRGDAGARELSTRRLTLDAGGSAEFHLDDEETVVVLQQGRGTFAVGAERWNVSRESVFTERATALYLPPAASLSVTAGDAARSRPVLDARTRRRPRRPDDAGWRESGGARPRTLRARGAQSVRRRPARAAADGRRNVQPAGQLEQLSAAQARRPRRRADAGRGLLLPRRSAAGVRTADAIRRTASR